MSSIGPTIKKWEPKSHGQLLVAAPLLTRLWKERFEIELEQALIKCKRRKMEAKLSKKVQSTYDVVLNKNIHGFLMIVK